MTLDEYAAWASGIRGAHDSMSPEMSELSYLGLGLAGECGEVVELIKKRLRDGAWDNDRLADELGDLAYYWARLCVAGGHAPSDVLHRSRDKIASKIKIKTGR